ncbi:hypothetical protein GCM10010260_67670 [Streptomyces filipinensis]|uniref:Uncharacterized protein n=1 Tax=Streptomyces filipinensis TaxID=66887 RepID=A0A918IHJ8_9ACTN|nr:hypothetical protein [Streptomyces filipinensis]GGV18336.1 hypothetical protein GCM10010260_67670 [Streptomyces filipinensis]
MPRAVDHVGPPGGEHTRRRAEAARLRRRPARPRVEVTVNEFTGTVSWRTLSARTPLAPGNGARRDRPVARTPESAPPTLRARAAALRAAGFDPQRVPARGAAPVPTHPAAVRAAVETSAASLSPEQQQAHLARVGMLRSQVSGDLSAGARMPSAVAARLRSAASPAQLHALSAAQTVSRRTASPAGGPATPNRAPAPGASPAPGPRR